MIVDKILPLIDKVKKKGDNSWVACCPVYEVVQAVGLELSDLFPEKTDVNGGKPLSKPFPAADILHCLNGEVIFLIVCAEALAKGKKLEELDKDKLYLSATRFRAAMTAGGLNHAA